MLELVIWNYCAVLNIYCIGTWNTASGYSSQSTYKKSFPRTRAKLCISGNSKHCGLQTGASSIWRFQSWFLAARAIQSAILKTIRLCLKVSSKVTGGQKKVKILVKIRKSWRFEQKFRNLPWMIYSQSMWNWETCGDTAGNLPGRVHIT